MSALVIGAFAANVVTWSEDRDATPDADSIARSAPPVDAALWDRVYGWYWTAVRSDQIVQGGPRWVHVECNRAGELRLMPWHNDTAVLRGRPATIAVALDNLGCSLPALERTYGPAARTTTLAGTRFARVGDRGRVPPPPHPQRVASHVGPGHADRSLFLLQLEELGVEVGPRLDVQLRHPLEPAREPPVAVAEQLHRRRHQHDANDGGVDEDRRRQAEAEQLDAPGRRRERSSRTP